VESERKPSAPSKKEFNSKNSLFDDCDDDAMFEKSASKSKMSYPSKSKERASKPISKSATDDIFSPSVSETSKQEDVEISADKQHELLSSFPTGSSNVEIIFSFDTTGSMASCLGEVRKKVSETVSRLMKDIPNIRIGIIAHGDYCDDADSGMEALSKLDFADSKQVKKICDFVNTVHATGGGDAPEAYEYALKMARSFSWTVGYSKALVIIGDEVPHPPSYTTEKINWWNEVDQLSDMGVKIYGIRALHNQHAVPFYEELSAKTGTVSIHFNNFKLIVDMFLAICYREASKEKLEQFEAEVKQKGNMNEELGQIFDTLSKPNPEKQKISSKEHDERAKQYPWYNISIDAGTPQFALDKKRKKWIHL